MRDTSNDTYLGDGLYAGFNGYHIVVYSHNGVYATNSVFLDRDVANNFIAYIKKRCNNKIWSFAHDQ